MDFTFSAEQDALPGRRSARSSPTGRRARRPGDGRRRARLRATTSGAQLVDLGWTGLLVPEEQGGLGSRAGRRRRRARGDGPGRVPGPVLLVADRGDDRGPPAGAGRPARRRSPTGRSAARRARGARPRRPGRPGPHPRPPQGCATGCSPAQKPLVLDGHTADWVHRRGPHAGRSSARSCIESPDVEPVPDASTRRRKVGRLRARRDAGDARRAARRPHGRSGARVADDAVGRARRGARRRVRGGARDGGRVRRRRACSSTSRSPRTR